MHVCHPSGIVLCRVVTSVDQIPSSFFSYFNKGEVGNGLPRRVGRSCDGDYDEVVM